MVSWKQGLFQEHAFGAPCAEQFGATCQILVAFWTQLDPEEDPEIMFLGIMLEKLRKNGVQKRDPKKHQILLEIIMFPKWEYLKCKSERLAADVLQNSDVRGVMKH